MFIPSAVQTLRLFLLPLLLGASVFGGTVSPARTALDGGDAQKAIDLLKDAADKDAEQFYLLGKAYRETGDTKQAHAAWNECLQINKNLAKADKWKFLFPPNKPLKGSQKSALKSAFESEFRTLNAVILRGEKKLATSKTNEADRTKTGAKRLDAASKKLTKKANAKSEAIKDKQRIADRQATRRPVRRRGGGLKIGGGVAAVILILIIGFFIFARPSGAVVDDGFHAAPFGTRRFDVMHDDGIFSAGAFWYMGRYYPTERHYYMAHGHHYSNAMYMDNYDSYGMGQGRDASLDHELREDIDEREYLREEAAEAGYEADVARADAEDLEQDAEEAEQRADEYEDSADSFDDDSEFSDDEGGEEEFEDDEGAEEFEDDEGAEEEEEFEDDAGAEEEEFEDDPVEEES